MNIEDQTTADSTSECRTDLQRAYWAERLLEALDASDLSTTLVTTHIATLGKPSTAIDSTALHDHIKSCKYCREAQQAILATDLRLQNQFAKSARSPALDFDAKLMARIDATEEHSRAERQQREMQHYQTQLAQLKQSWRQLVGRSLSTSIGIIATLLVALLSFGSALEAAMPALSGEAGRLTTLVEKLGITLLPVGAVFFSVTFAAFALWLARRSDRQLR